MAGSVPNSTRDFLITSFRKRIMEKMSIIPLVHQAKWFAAADGLTLLEYEDPDGVEVRLSDGTIVHYQTQPREYGRAKVLADLGAFKTGKSFGGGLFAAGFGGVPSSRVQLVGAEYDMCEPEFNYIADFLLSDNGMGMKARHYQNQPKAGKMWLELENGAKFEAKSWERKDSMKGKEVDLYLYCEAYQLPSLECYHAFNQNLRARDGYAVFATTPDRPWVNDIHVNAHGGDPDFRAWHCTCSVHSSENPLTFSAAAMSRDRKLMTKEKFAIHYEGKLGDFVGRVFNYQRGDLSYAFTPTSHPQLFRGSSQPTFSNLSIPDGWEIIGGVDTGTYSSAVVVAFSPEGDAFVLGDFPNYDYVASAIERDEASTIPAWIREITNSCDIIKARYNFWADPNSQFKKELLNYRVNLIPNKIPLEARTEITREYFQNRRIYLAPWLKVLPFELENACWPEEASATGKFARIKDRDHTLDCLEHILSRRPKGRWVTKTKTTKSWGQSYASSFPSKTKKDPHLGGQ